MIYGIISPAGEVPKRSKGAVSKTARGCKSRMGPNPIFSANHELMNTLKACFLLQKNNRFCDCPLFNWFNEEVSVDLY